MVIVHFQILCDFWSTCEIIQHRIQNQMNLLSSEQFVKMSYGGLISNYKLILQYLLTKE